MVEILIKKRDGLELNKTEFTRMINGFTSGEIPDYQISAFLMAAYINGLSNSETAILTEAMMRSGEVVDLSEIEGVKVDKHSTGGVGDKTTLVLVPLVAAAGVPVAKMSGRGLGYTGGTIDKLESIDGFSVDMTVSQFVDRIHKYGIALCGQTESMVPADKKLYALRDVTGTVSNLSLIASSIMSKKLACGADAIVIDIKVGNGAYMATQKEAENLAKLMMSISEKMDKKITVVITSMKEPLGCAVGNALEVKEAIETLKGEGPSDLIELCLNLGSHMLVLAEKAQSQNEARLILQDLLDSGKAFGKFKEFVTMQGGDPSVIENPNLLPKSKYSRDYHSDGEGYISKLHAKAIGLASMKLGAGRETQISKIDHGAGIILKKKIGAYVKKGDVLATMYCNEIEKFDIANDLLYSAYEIRDRKPVKTPLIIKTIK